MTNVLDFLVVQLDISERKYAGMVGWHKWMSRWNNTYPYNLFYEILQISGGEMFDHLIRSGPYSEEDAARLIREVASALNFLHGIGFVHG